MFREGADQCGLKRKASSKEGVCAGSSGQELDRREKKLQTRRKNIVSKSSEASVKMLIHRLWLYYNSCSVGKGQMNKLRAESKGNFESNADIKDILLNRIKTEKEKLHTAYRKTSSKMRISGLPNKDMNKSLQ